MNTANEILTSGNGKPIAKPVRADFASDVDYCIAFHAYKDDIAKCANGSFVAAFNSTIRSGK